MASIPMYDPLSTQARSSWLAGLTEACNKISNILNMSTSDFVDLELPELYISPLDRYRIYQAPLGNKLWLTMPKPVVKKNGVVITESADGFSIDYLGGSIIFDEGYTLTADDVVTVSATYISNESSELKEILRTIDEVSEKADSNKGYYATLTELTVEVPEGKAGDYAFVADGNKIYMWDDTADKWENTSSTVDLSDYATTEYVDTELDKKENVIQSYGDTTADDLYYYGGRKTWQAIEPRVRDTKLTGLNTSGTAQDKITANDSVLSALGKLQAQANDNIHPQQGTGAPTENTAGRIGEDYVNTSNGDIYHLVSISSGKYIWEKYANISDVNALKEYVDNKKVEVDAVPTDGSNNAVSSDGVYDALQGKQDKSTGSAGQLAGYNTEGNLSPVEGAYFNYNAGNNTLNIDIEGNLNVDGESNLQGFVPDSRTINGKPLSEDITLNASDVGAVPTSRTINGQPLTSDIVIANSGGNSNVIYAECNTDANISTKVISKADYTLETGKVVFIKFNKGNTAENLALNIQSTGAKTVSLPGLTSTWSLSISPYQVVGFVYDGANYRVINGNRFDAQNKIEYFTGSLSSESVFNNNLYDNYNLFGSPRFSMISFRVEIQYSANNSGFAIQGDISNNVIFEKTGNSGNGIKFNFLLLPVSIQGFGFIIPGSNTTVVNSAITLKCTAGSLSYYIYKTSYGM